MIPALRPTHHASMRMSQRGISHDDLDLLRWMGTEVEGGYLVRDKDFQALDRKLKQIRAYARRLVGKRIVLDGETVITLYHAERRKQRSLLRRAEDRSLME